MFSIRKSFLKTNKNDWEAKKKLDAITDENKRVEVLTNKDDHKSIYKKIFDRVVKERFGEIKELTYEIDHEDVIYYLKNNTNKNFNDFDDGIELVKKIQSGEMKLEDAKELQNIFNSNLNKISKGKLNQKIKILNRRLNLLDKINLKRSQEYVALSNLSFYYTWKNIEKSYKNNKFKISAQTWNEKFELPDGSYSVLDIQDYFEYILKKHEKVTENPSIRIYIDKIENRIISKIKRDIISKF